MPHRRAGHGSVQPPAGARLRRGGPRLGDDADADGRTGIPTRSPRAGSSSSAHRRPGCRSPTRSSARAARSRWRWESTCGGPARTGVGTSTGGWRRPACSTSATTRWTTSCAPAACRRCSSAGSTDRATFDLNALTGIGVKLVGRLAGIRDGRAQFSGSLRNKCDLADLKLDRLLDTVDEWATANGMDDEVPPPHRFAPTVVSEPPTLGLDLGQRGDPDHHLGDRLPARLLLARRGCPRRQGDGPPRRWCRRLARDVPDRHAVPASTEVELHRRRPSRCGGPHRRAGPLPGRAGVADEPLTREDRAMADEDARRRWVPRRPLHRRGLHRRTVRRLRSAGGEGRRLVARRREHLRAGRQPRRQRRRGHRVRGGRARPPAPRAGAGPGDADRRRPPGDVGHARARSGRRRSPGPAGCPRRCGRSGSTRSGRSSRRCATWCSARMRGRAARCSTTRCRTTGSATATAPTRGPTRWPWASTSTRARRSTRCSRCGPIGWPWSAASSTASPTTSSSGRATASPAPGYPEETRTVGACLRVVMVEECEHHRYAVRDLAILEAQRQQSA